MSDVPNKKAGSMKYEAERGTLRAAGGGGGEGAGSGGEFCSVLGAEVFLKCRGWGGNSAKKERKKTPPIHSRAVGGAGGCSQITALREKEEGKGL